MGYFWLGGISTSWVQKLDKKNFLNSQNFKLYQVFKYNFLSQMVAIFPISILYKYNH